MVKINVDSILESQHNFCESFDQFGWDKILDLHVNYYSALVRQYYTSIDQKDKFSTNITYVKGVYMRVTRDLLALIYWERLMTDFHLSMAKLHSHTILIGI